MNQRKLAATICLTILLFPVFLWAQDDVDELKAEAREGILVFESKDKEFKWWLDTRVYLDGACYFDNLNDLGSGTEIRRARFAVKTKLWGKWNGELDIDFRDNAIDIQDAYLKYNFSDNLFLKIGNFKEPFGLERPTTSRHLTFLERSYLGALTPGRSLGTAATYFNDHWYASMGIFGQEVEELDVNDDEGWAFTSRFAYAPVSDNRKVIHFGFSATRRTPNADEDGLNHVRFRTGPETHVSRARYLNTGWIENVKYHYHVGVEGALAYGPFSLQSEAIQAEVHKESDFSVFHGWYLMATWAITGESRPYNHSEAEFLRIIPRHKYGAFELALRYSNLDLNEYTSLVFGGEAENYTLGLNWYANKSVKMMANYVYVNNDRYADGDGDLYAGDVLVEEGLGGDDFSFVQLRFEIDF